MQYYSQFGQDKFLHEKFFNYVKDGYFIDIGAHNGETGSNTLFFETLGWNGICIEPNPEQFDALILKRKCKCLKYAISDKNEISQFFQIKEGKDSPTMLSGLINEYYSNSFEKIKTSCRQVPRKSM